MLIFREDEMYEAVATGQDLGFIHILIVDKSEGVTELRPWPFISVDVSDDLKGVRFPTIKQNVAIEMSDSSKRMRETVDRVRARMALPVGHIWTIGPHFATMDLGGGKVWDADPVKIKGLLADIRAENSYCDNAEHFIKAWRAGM